MIYTMSPWSRSEQRRRAKRAVVASVLGCQIRQKLVFVELYTTRAMWIHDFQKKPSCQRIKDTLRSSDFCVSFRELSSTKKPVQHTPVSSPSLGLTTRVKHICFLSSFNNKPTEYWDIYLIDPLGRHSYRCWRSGTLRSWNLWHPAGMANSVRPFVKDIERQVIQNV